MKVTGREERSESTTRGTSESQTTKMVYFTIEGERELLVNNLQALPTRQFFLASEPLVGCLLEAPFVPDELYSYQLRDFPRELLERQRQRFQLEIPADQTELVQLKAKPPAAALPAIETPQMVEQQIEAPKSKSAQRRKVEPPPVLLPVEDEDDPFLD